MKTSKSIKTGQYEPAKIEKNGRTYSVESKSKPYSRTVTRRKGNEFWCDCPAKSRTCRHVTAVIVREMKAQGFGLVQIWTSEADAKRQRRKVYRATRNGKQFWITVGQKDTLAGVVRFCLSWDYEAVDLFYRKPSGSDYHVRREDLRSQWDTLKDAPGFEERGNMGYRERVNQ